MKTMKTKIDVEVVMEQCKDCPRLELETAQMPMINIHRCKHVQLCRTIIEIWEKTKRGEAE